MLTDIKMPHGVPHGLALANMARMRRSYLHVIAYPELLEGLARQPGEVFRKPLDFDLLVATIFKAACRDQQP